MSKAQKLLKKSRGASMVEYALLIIAIMLLAALAYRKLGTAVQKNAADSETELGKRGG
jgi:Flp pilus assembly pilin Flp